MSDINFFPFPVLYTERLTLRAITMDDAPQFFLLRSDPEVTKYADRFPPKSIEEIHSFMNSIQSGIAKNELIAWAICEKDKAEFIGTITFHKIYPQHYRAEIGYQLLPQYWKKGLMSEALKAVIDYGFTGMKLHSIEAQTNPHNEASIQLLLKHGFVQEALFRENYFFDGKFLDTPVFSLLNRKN